MRSVRTLLASAVVVGMVVTGVVAQDNADSGTATTQPAAKQPVDFRKLKELMPAELAGIKRTNTEGQRSNFAELRISTASADYNKEEGDNPPSVRVEIVDYGGTAGTADMLAVWSQMEIDTESDDGYEKTTKIKGHPAYEKFQTESKSGDMTIYVAKRFLVTVRTTELPAEQLKKAAEALPLDKLVELAK